MNISKNSKERNATIDIFRIICAIMVIAIHTHPFEDINMNLSYIATQVFPRIAVPFFFCVTGYYYIKKLQSGKADFKKVFFKYLQLYLIWSGIYLIYNLIVWVKNDYSIFLIIKSIIAGLFVNGISAHLWYFLGIFFSLIVVTICYKKFKRLDILAYFSIALYIIGLLGTSYYEIGNKIPIINELINLEHFTFIRRIVLMGFPFFMMGYYLQNIKIKELKPYYMLEIIFIALFIIEILIINKLDIATNIIITIILYPLLFNTMILLLNKPLQNMLSFAERCRNIANFTYYSHILILNIVIVVLNNVFNFDSSTINFLVTTVMCIILGNILERIDNKRINKLYK